MRLSSLKIKEICERNNISLTDALRRSHISRTAYYSLTRKESVTPKSLNALAEFLKVSVSDLLFDEAEEKRKHLELLAEVDEINSVESIHERDNVRHTLLSLRRPPMARLQAALIRNANKGKNVRKRAA